MRETKLYHHLNFLSLKDRKAFGLYLTSPWFNRNEEVVRLFELLDQRLFKIDEKKRPDLQEADIFGLVFPGQDLDENAWRKLKTALLTLLYSFLAQREYEEAAGLEDRFLLQALNRQGEGKSFSQLYKKAKKSLEKKAGQSEEYFELLYHLEEEYNLYLNRQGNRAAQNNLNSVLSRLDQNYQVKRLKYACAILNQKNFQDLEEFVGDQKTAVKQLNLPTEDLEPLIHAYYFAYRTLQYPNQAKYYRELIEFLSNNGHLLGAAECHEVYQVAMNYAVRRINQGELAYQNDLLGIYKELLESGQLLHNGLISPFTLKNLVLLGSRLGEFAWVESILKTYVKKLYGPNQEQLSNFSQGILNLYKKDFPKAVRYFNRVLDEYEDVFYGIDARRYLLYAYYEQGDLQGMEGMCNSFRVFLHRNKEVLPERKKNQETFIRLYRRLYQLPPGDEKKRKKLKKELKEIKKFSGREWLLEKVESL